MAAAMKKGTEVYYIREWNLGTGYVQKFIVESMGKKQATLSSVATGEMLKTQVYAHDYAKLHVVSETPDPVAIALEVGRVSLANSLARHRANVASVGDNAYWIKETAKIELMQPQGLSEEQVAEQLAEIRRNAAAKYAR